MIWQVNDLAWRVIDLIWRVNDLIWQVSDLMWSVNDLIWQVNDGYFSVGTESGREADVWGVSGRFQGRPHHHPSSDVVWRQSLTLTQPLSFPHPFFRHSAGLHLQISSITSFASFGKNLWKGNNRIYKQRRLRLSPLCCRIFIIYFALSFPKGCFVVVVAAFFLLLFFSPVLQNNCYEM